MQADTGERRAAYATLTERANTLLHSLPVPAIVTGNREARTAHIQVKGEVSVGRIRRQAGDLLCGDKAHQFHAWGLEEIPGRAPDCLRCLEIAERLAKEQG